MSFVEASAILGGLPARIADATVAATNHLMCRSMWLPSADPVRFLIAFSESAQADVSVLVRERNPGSGSPRWRCRPARSDGRFGVVLDATTDLPGSLHGVEPRDKVERHVDPRGDAGGGDHLPGVDEPVVGPNLDVLTEAAERLQLVPVGRRRPAVEESRIGEDEGAGADARHERAALREITQPARDPSITELSTCSSATGVDEHVDRRSGSPRVIRQDAQPLRAGDRSLRLSEGERLDLIVRPVRGPIGEHLPWPRPVELLRVGEERDADPRPGLRA